MSAESDLIAQRALIVSIVAAGISAIAALFTILQWRAGQRRSWAEWTIDQDYVIDLARDQVRFPYVFRRQIPGAIARGILVRLTYHGRFSVTVVGFTYDWNFTQYASATVQPRVLNDGESWEALIFHNEIDMGQITAVTVLCEGGITFRSDINFDYHERMNMHLGNHE